jgi:hypothetical protein
MAATLAGSLACQRVVSEKDFLLWSDNDGAIQVDGIVHQVDQVDWESLADEQSTLLKETARLEAHHQRRR